MLSRSFPLFAPGILALAGLGGFGCSGTSRTDSLGGDPSQSPRRDAGEGGAQPTAEPGPTQAPDAQAPDEHDSGAAAPAQIDLDGAPLYSRVVRLTNPQWSAAVKDLLKLTEAPATVLFETPAEQVKLFTNNEALMDVTNTQYSNYELSAEALASAVTASDVAFAAVYAGTERDDFIKTFGRRAYRRPLTDGEVGTYQTVFETGSQLDGPQNAFTKGAGLVIETMLQSPHFLYRPELGEDGAPLNGFELASKLSFWLTGSTPSDALLDLAEAGALDTPEGLVEQATLMLEGPGARAMLSDLHGQLFEFKRLTDVSKNDPAYTGEAMNAELLAAAEAFFDTMFSQDLGLKEILTSPLGFVGPELAGLYGIAPAPAALTRVDLGAARLGYFSQVPFLMANSAGVGSDAIHRGLRLHQRVLCGKLGEPSPNVTLVEPQASWTQRDQVEATTGAGTCGGDCHGAYINPLGFALENFDGLGRARETDNGQPVDTRASYPLPEGTITFSGAPDLMQQLAVSDMAHRCYARNLAGYALQRDIVAADLPLLDELKTVSMSNGSIKQLILNLVKHPSFRTRTGGAQ